MSSNPYENEPGFETANDENDKKNQRDYVAKVRHSKCEMDENLTSILDTSRVSSYHCHTKVGGVLGYLSFRHCGSANLRCWV
jgi:hypothetical protein